MLTGSVNKYVSTGLMVVTLALAGCGGGEGRQAEYLERATDFYEQDNIEKARIEIKNVLQINPKNAEARYLLGMMEEKDKNYRAAFGNFTAAVDTDPNHIKSLNKLASYHILSKEIEKGLEFSEQVLALDANNADALAAKSTYYLAKEDSDKAIVLAQQALASEPGHVAATAILTSIYSKDDPDLALKIIGDGIAQQSKTEVLKMLKIQVLTSQNKSAEVIATYQELMAEHPDNLLYAYQLVNFHLSDESRTEEERKQVAEAMLRDLVKTKPEEEKVKLWLVEFLGKNISQDSAVKALEEFVAQDPANFTLRDNLAKAYFTLKRTDEAKKLYNDAIESDPRGTDAIESRLRLVTLALSEKDVPQAELILAEIFSIEPENVDAMLVQAKLKLQAGDFNGAIPDLRVVLKNAPDSVDALGLMGAAQEKTGSTDLALDTYQRLLSIDANNVGGLLSVGRLLVAKDRAEEALPVLEAALKAQPGNPEATRLLTDLYSRDQRWDDALSISAKLVENENTAAMGYYLQGRTYLRKKDFKQAIKSLEQSQQADPRIIESLTALISSYMATEQKDKAMTYVTQHIAKHPEHLHARELKARLYINLEKRDKAEAEFKAVIAEAPTRINTYRDLGRLYAIQNKLAEIESLYEQGLAANPGNTTLSLMLAEAYQVQAKHQQAIDQYEALLAENPDSLVVRNNLASLLLDHFNNEANINRAVELSAELMDTENAAFLDTAGWAQYQAGNIPQALSLLQAAVASGGTGPVFQYHLGMAYYKSEMSDKAKQLLTEALADDNVDFVGIEEAKRVLSTL